MPLSMFLELSVAFDPFDHSIIIDKKHEFLYLYIPIISNILQLLNE